MSGLKWDGMESGGWLIGGVCLLDSGVSQVVLCGAVEVLLALDYCRQVHRECVGK